MHDTSQLRFDGLKDQATRFVCSTILFLMLTKPLLSRAVLPLYRTDHGLSNSAANADYMMLYTLSNVPPRSSRLWAPWTLVLAFSAYALYVITMHFCSYAILHTLRPHVLPTTHMSDGLVTRLIGRSKERASIWSNLLCMVSPWRMYQNDLKLAAHWMKEVEETTKAMHEGKPEHHFGCPGHLEDHYEQEVREALLTAGEEAGMKDDGKWTIPESVCPWWKLPEDIPPEINPVVAGGGVLLGKSCAHRRDRIPGDKGKKKPKKSAA